jgi:membrane associated rhomboid family serine protease
MNDLISKLLALITAMEANMYFVLMAIGIMWLVNFVNWWLLGSGLNILGVYPRRLFGLVGIPTSPILHGHFNHLFFNTFPLFILANLVLLAGYNVFYCITAIIVFGCGIIVWIIGRPAFHLGASGLIMGYWSYLLIQAYEQQTIMSLVLGAISLYYFGGLLLSLFPDKREVSWEAHVAGFLSGISAYFITPHIMQTYGLPIT